MFWNKMKLASLIVLIALGFIATPVMAATFPTGARVPDQEWKQGQANISITFPTATAEVAGTLSATLAIGTTTFNPGDTLSGVLTGLTFTFDATTGVGKLEGDNAHNVITTLTLVTYTVTEVGGPSAVLRAFGVTIIEADELTFPANARIADKVLIVGTPFGEVLPTAVGGVGPLEYSIVGTLPTGITFTAANRLLTGIPTTPAGRAVITYRVTDSDTPEATADLSFTIEVTPRPTGPSFAITKVPDAAYTKGHPITAMTLPAANTTYAVGSVTYALTGLPAGLSFDPTSRELSGTPNPTNTGPITATYTATDAARNADDVPFTITVNPVVSPTAPPDFPAAGTSYLRGQRFADIIVPNATGGTGNPADYTYAVTGLPVGLMFNATETEKVITGTPTAVGISTVTITATDSLGATGSDDFRITVSAVPALSFSHVILPKTYEAGTPITPEILPTGTGGIPPYTYALEGLPNGITFDPATRILRGTPAAAQGPTDYDYIISDSAFSHVTAPTADQMPNTITFPFTITVRAAPGSANNAPDFGTQTIPNIDAMAGVRIPGRFLPEATDADGDTLTYSIVETLPDGLDFSSTTRALTGTPTTPQPQTAYTYKVEDGNGGMDTIGFFITVTGDSTPPPTSVYMYWTDAQTRKIQRATLDGTHVTDHIIGLDSPHDIAVDVTGGHIYWTVATGSIQRANLDGTNIETLVTGLLTPEGLALDIKGGHIYWTTATTGSIQRANLDGANLQTLVTGLLVPRGLALDIKGGKMYWTVATGSIQRADLNGTNIETVIPRGTGLLVPRGLALDITGGKMYWTDGFTGSIQRANLDGTNIENLVNIENPAGLALDIEAAKMYWAAQNPGSIQRANLDGTNIENLVAIGLNHPYGIALGIPILPPDPGPIDPDPLDVDGDGQVTVIDLAIVALLYGTRVPGGLNFPADVNADGSVDLLDLTLVAQGIDAANASLGKLTLPELEAAWAAAAEQTAVLEAGAAAPDALSSGNLAAHNVAAALTDVKHLATGDKHLESGVPVVLETLLELLGETKARPETSALLPNYPNPFNPETWLPYQLSTPAEVALSIYSVDGQLVRTLKIGHQPAGIYQSKHRAAYWDGKNQHGEKVASGVYFYVLTAGDFTATRKLLIAK